jgi:hypothetical protein
MIIGDAHPGEGEARMPAADMVILVLAVVELLAVVAMAIAAFMMYQRVKTVTAWAQPSVQETKAIAARAQATALESKNRALAFAQTFRTLVRRVGQKVQTTKRLAREIVHPDRTPLEEAARVLAGPAGVARRLSRLHEAGKVAAGQGNGSRSRG